MMNCKRRFTQGKWLNRWSFREICWKWMNCYYLRSVEGNAYSIEILEYTLFLFSFEKNFIIIKFLIMKTNKTYQQ